MQFKNITNEKKLQEKKTTNLRGKLLLSSFFATLARNVANSQTKPKKLNK